MTKDLKREMMGLMVAIRSKGLEDLAREKSPYAYESVMNFINHGVIGGKKDVGDPGQMEVSVGLCSALKDPWLWAISDPTWLEFVEEFDKGRGEK